MKAAVLTAILLFAVASRAHADEWSPVSNLKVVSVANVSKKKIQTLGIYSFVFKDLENSKREHLGSITLSGTPGTKTSLYLTELDSTFEFTPTEGVKTALAMLKKCTAHHHQVEFTLDLTAKRVIHVSSKDCP